MNSSPDDLIRLLSLAAHELRSPLSVASGYMKMLAGERQGPLTDAQRSSVEAAIRACDQLTTLAADLSALARLERGETTLSRVNVATAALVEEAVAYCRTRAAHPVAFESAGNGDGEVLVDPVRTRQSICALITAVARAIPEGSTLRVSRAVHADGGRGDVRIVIAEAGQADAEAGRDHPHLPPVDESEGGLGLSLPIALRLLRLEGGDVRALDTDAPGVVISLPLAPPGTDRD